MNHLAHAHLSACNSDLLVGNLSADYLRKRECLELPLKLQDGVALHRHIDHQTDNHPAVRRCWAILREPHGKYASVIFDIYCDYLLSQHWDSFSRHSLGDIADDAYGALRRHASQLPDPLSARFERMIQSDWLRQYGTYEGQAYVFERFGKRLSKPQLLQGVIDSLKTHEQEFVTAFKEFYPWMQASCARFIAKV